MLAAATACGQRSSASSAPAGPGPGVVFAYPIDGQWDVPLRTRLLLGFSTALPATVDTACSRMDGRVTGAFCVEGPGGFVHGALTIDGSTLVFVPTGGLAAGATYRVWARPALLPGATNLPADAPLLTFHARSTRTRAGVAATVLTVNGAPLAADGTSPLPFQDVAPVRLVFSEPLDTTTVGSGTVHLRTAGGVAVDGVAVAEGVHLTFDPAEALSAGATYRLEVTAGVHDLGGEAIAPVALTFTPRQSAPPGQALYALPLTVAPAWTDGTPPLGSRIGGMAVNTYSMSSLLGADARGGILAGGFDASVGDPAAGRSMPVVIRRGGRLDLTSATLRAAGFETGVPTGTIHFTLLTDASGFMTRNPFRSPEQTPDDAESPAFLDLTVDAALTSDDPIGNALSAQAIMGVRVLGIVTMEGGQLVAEQVAALDLDVLGVETAPVSMVLRMRTGDRAAAAALGLAAAETGGSR